MHVTQLIASALPVSGIGNKNKSEKQHKLVFNVECIMYVDEVTHLPSISHFLNQYDEFTYKNMFLRKKNELDTAVRACLPGPVLGSHWTYPNSNCLTTIAYFGSRMTFLYNLIMILHG